MASAHIVPSVDQFAEVLSQEEHWYDLGVYLGVPTHELNAISQNYATNGIRRCLIELYGCLEKKGKQLSWKNIATAVMRIGNSKLANEIRQVSKSPKSIREEEIVNAEAGAWVVGEFKSLRERLVLLTLEIQMAFEQSDVGVQRVQMLVQGLRGIPHLPPEEATFDAVFIRLMMECSILNFDILSSLVKNLLNNDNLQKKISNLKSDVDQFRSSTEMVELVGTIEQKQDAGDHKKVKLKVREFWCHFTIEQFEIVMNEILETLYHRLSNITVGKGCICVSWVIPDHINARKLVPKISLEFVQIIGVISLHIGNTVIYNIGGKGCETIEAAMLQAIELKNTRAVELLLAVGCNPKVATYNEDNAITTIVNIREKSCSSSGSGHVCILGQNKHVEAIVDPSREPECSSCAVNKKITKHLQQEIDELCQQEKVLKRQNQTLMEQKKLMEQEMNLKAAENTLLNKANQMLIKEKNEKAAENTLLIKEKNEKDAELIKLRKQLEKKEQLEKEDYHGVLYHALTFYEQKARHRYEYTFVAIKSLPAHIKYVQSSPAFCSQEQGKSFQFRFKDVPDPQITLEFREPDLEGKLDDCCVGKGWCVEPYSTPSCITRKEIDSLGQELQVQGQDGVLVYPVIPACMVHVYATATTTDNLRYPVLIQGMVEQKTIYIQRFIDDQEPAVPSQQQTMDVPDLTTPSLPVLQNLQIFDVTELTAIVKNVLSKNENRLKELLQHSLEAFAGNMQEASLIDQSVARDPTYSKIIDQFVASMSYMEEKEEVEEHCTALLKALRNVGGPLVLPCKFIKNQFIKEVKEKLKLDLTLHIDF